MVVLAPKSPFIDSVFKWVFPQDLLWLKEKGPLYQLWLDHFLCVPINQNEKIGWPFTNVLPLAACVFF
jgi:hypothetical protein